ncbi:MAG: NfeD family protein [Pseudomonadota bacterium]
MDIFGFLDGASPWWWVAGAFALGIVEVLTFSFFLIWPGLAALSVAAVLWMFPETSGAGQLVWFAVLSVVYTFIGRRMVMSRPTPAEQSGLNNRALHMVGRTLELADDLTPGAVSTFEIDGIRWRGRLEEGAATARAGQTVQVTDTDGMLLLLARRL